MSSKKCKKGNFQGGFHFFGLDKDGVAYALDENNKPLISAETLKKLKRRKKKLLMVR